jgi:pimeloyl-ACP methyl ester carboxylesterase
MAPDVPPAAPPPGAVRHLEVPGGVRLAYATLAGAAPTVVFLGGFGSDMTGAKATALEAWARRARRAFVRFDYRGHGRSSGRLEEGTIGAWRDDALAVLAACTAGPLVLVGSSMGAWIMLLCALALPGRLHALVGVAAAPDFTEDLVWARLDAADRAALLRDGVLPWPAGAPHSPPVSRALVEDGRRHLVLRAEIAVPCPVRLLHGLADPDVPWETSLRLAEQLASPDVTLTLVKGGGHRLSTPGDLALLEATVAGL